MPVTGVFAAISNHINALQPLIRGRTINMTETTYPYVIEDVSLDLLTRNHDFQYRTGGLHWPTVDKYTITLEARDEDLLNRPMNAVVGQGGQLLLIDGHHRWHAYKRAEDKHGQRMYNTVRFVKVHGDATQLSVDEIKLIAMQINDANGLPNRRPDQKEKIRLWIVTGKHLTDKGRCKSFGTIAIEARVPKSSTHDWIREMFPSVAIQIAAQTKPDWHTPNRNGGFRSMRKVLKDGFTGFAKMCEVHKTMTIMGAPAKELAKQREMIEWCATKLNEMKRDLTSPTEGSAEMNGGDF
jgi:hypothetical protein